MTEHNGNLVADLNAALQSNSNPHLNHLWFDRSLVARFLSNASVKDWNVETDFLACLSNWAKSHFPTFPLVHRTTEELIETFRQLLIVDMGLPHDCVLNANQVWSVPFWAGAMISTHFMQGATLDVACQTTNRDTANTVWRDDHKRLMLLKNALRRLSDAKPFSAALVRAAAQHRHILPSSFQPCIVVAMIDTMTLPSLHAFAETSKPVSMLDPCAGWGHRFIGFWASKRGGHYVGFDPNSVLHEPYAKIAEFLQASFPPQEPKTFSFVRECAESDQFVSTALARNNGRLYDLVLTCPPYFDVESYSTESTQSDVRFTTYAEWRTGFLERMIINGARCLRQNGLFGLVVSNCNSCPTLCEDVIAGAISAGLKETYSIRLVLKKQDEDDSKPTATNKKWPDMLFVFRRVKNE